MSGGYSDGDGVEFVLRKAAEQGDARAQYNLGWCYYKGDGVAKDYAIAYMWLNLEPSLSGMYLREDVKKRMTIHQIVEGQRLSREWKPRGE